MKRSAWTKGVVVAIGWCLMMAGIAACSDDGGQIAGSDDLLPEDQASSLDAVKQDVSDAIASLEQKVSDLEERLTSNEGAKQPLAIVTDKLPDCLVGKECTKIFTASGGSGKYTWSLDGTLPEGLTFDAGKLAGEASVPGPVSFTVTVSDADDASSSIAKEFSLEVKETIALNATIGGKVVKGGAVTLEAGEKIAFEVVGDGPYTIEVSAADRLKWTAAEKTATIETLDSSKNVTVDSVTVTAKNAADDVAEMKFTSITLKADPCKQALNATVTHTTPDETSGMTVTVKVSGGKPDYVVTLDGTLIGKAKDEGGASFYAKTIAYADLHDALNPYSAVVTDACPGRESVRVSFIAIKPAAASQASNGMDASVVDNLWVTTAFTLINDVDDTGDMGTDDQWIIVYLYKTLPPMDIDEKSDNTQSEVNMALAKAKIGAIGYVEYPASKCWDEENTGDDGNDISNCTKAKRVTILDSSAKLSDINYVAMLEHDTDGDSFDFAFDRLTIEAKDVKGTVAGMADYVAHQFHFAVLGPITWDR